MQIPWYLFWPIIIKKIYVFDTRYYKQGPSSFIKEHPGITDVLILYNMNTLDSDLGIRGIY